MMSNYSRVCGIYTPCHSFRLGYPCIYVHPPSLVEDVLGGRNRACLQIHLEAEIEQVWRCTWSPRERVNSEMHLEAVTERERRYIWSQ